MLIRTALVLGLCIAPIVPTMAQEIPDWIGPSDDSADPDAEFGLDLRDPDARVGPDLPPDPAPVPLDGLGWLALVGAGYAARRLRR